MTRRKTVYARIVQQVHRTCALTWDQRKDVYKAVRRALALHYQAALKRKKT